ncbi:MAG TPA: O-antigen ligase family protein [Nocardioides sp.]|nr:O-antigen ligase family protein [Nocardioides sp.]
MTLRDRVGALLRLAAEQRHHPLALSVAVVIVMLPFGDRFVAGFSLVYVAMAVSAVLVVRILVRDEQPIPSSVLLLGLGLGVVVSVMAAALGVSPGAATMRVALGLVALGYAAGIAMARRPGLDRDATDLLVVAGGVTAAKALTAAGSLTTSTNGWVVDGRLTGPFAQPNELGMFCAALLPIAVACLVARSSRLRATVLGVASVCILAAWVLSMSRGAWIGGAVSLVFLAVVEPRSRRLLRAAGSTLAATCVLAFALPVQTPLLGVIGARLRSLGDADGNEYDARPLIWGEAWRQITQRPWFGVGPDGYRVAATDSASAVSSYGAEHPHDLYLTVLVERGVTGMAAGAVVVAGVAVALRRHLQSRGSADPAAVLVRTRALAVLAALVAVAVHGVFDLPLRNPIVSGLVSTLLGMAVAAEIARPAPAGRGATPDPAPLLLTNDPEKRTTS